MSDSATTTPTATTLPATTPPAIPTPAAERRQATASRLTERCRDLTIERGLNGFTIDEVCAEVGISRRTFFNYFPSKEDAVFGADSEEDGRRVAEDFLARGTHSGHASGEGRVGRGWPAVVDDLIDIAAHYADNAGVTASDHARFMRVLDREPRLLVRFIGLSKEREAGLLALVAEREGVSVSDARARASVAIVMTVLRSVGERVSDPDVAGNFGATLRSTLAAIRAVLTPSV